MPERYIDKDEWYPVFTLSERRLSDETKIHISHADLAEYHRIMAEFKALQAQLTVWEADADRA